MAIVWDKVKRFRLLALLITGFLVLVFALVVNLPRIAESIAVNALESAGFENIELSKVDAGVNGASVSLVRFRYPQDGGAIGAELGGLELDWTLPELLGGQLLALRIEHLVVFVPNTEFEEPSQLVLPDSRLLFDLLSNPVHEQVPVQRVEIDEIVIRQDASPGIVANLEISKQEGQVALESRVQHVKGDLMFQAIVDQVPDGVQRLSVVLSNQEAQDLFFFTAQYEERTIGYQAGITNELVQWFAPDASLGLSFSNAMLAGELYPAPPDREGVTWAGMAKLNLSEWAADEYSADATTVDLTFEWSQTGSETNLDAVAGIQLDQVNAPDDVVLSDVSVDTKVNAGPDLDKFLFAESSMAIEKASMGGYFETGSVLARTPILEWDGKRLIAQAPVTVTADDVRVVNLTEAFDAQIILQQMTYDIDRGDLNLTGTWVSDAVAASLDDVRLETSGISQKFELKQNVLSMRGSFEERPRGIKADTSLTLDFNSNQLTGSVQPELFEITGPEQLRSLLLPYPFPVDVVTGVVHGDMQLSWDIASDIETLSAQVQLKIENLGGAFDEYFFSGLGTEFAISVLPAINTVQPVQLQIESIDAGFPVTDVTAQLSVSQQGPDAPLQIDLHSALAQALGGYVALQPASIDLAQAEHELGMVLIRTDVDIIVRLQEIDDLDASGRLSGQIPIQINEAGVTVSDGRIYALEPGGLIRYGGDVSAVSSAAGPAGFVFEALQHFEYSSMNVFPEYSPDGTLDMRLEIRGRNPQVEEGRPINLNINLEQNLLQLRESLRYVDGLNEAIDETVQEYYRSNQTGQ